MWERRLLGIGHEGKRHERIVSNGHEIATIQHDNGSSQSEANIVLMVGSPDMLLALEDVYHQLATDSDLENVSGARKYAELTKIVAKAIAKADPCNPQIRFNHEAHE